MEADQARFKVVLSDEPDDGLDGLRRLAAAVIVKAVEDARSSDNPAVAASSRQWLASLGLDIMQELGWSRQSVLDWLAGLPELAQMSLL